MALRNEEKREERREVRREEQMKEKTTNQAGKKEREAKVDEKATDDKDTESDLRFMDWRRTREPDEEQNNGLKKNETKRKEKNRMK